MMKILNTVLFLGVFVFFTCTPYNSSETNRKMLQGHWVLYDLDIAVQDDTAFYSNMRDTAIIIFERDSCYDFFVKPNVLLSYSFNVDNYEISTYVNDSLISKSEILALSNDSLVLEKKNVKFKYKKFETNYREILKN